jgi:hypothetical protein
MRASPLVSHLIPTRDNDITIRLCDDCPRLFRADLACHLSRDDGDQGRATRADRLATPAGRPTPGAAHPYYMYDCRADGRGDASCPGEDAPRRRLHVRETPSPRIHKNNKNYNYIIINMIADSHR